ncbi:hypothetical protein [Rhodococcoides fascians]|uniref:hypothetical protein n=1 Tax=Rhodococcoides fascians TaxID=1828 RepID=UPI00050C1328|nr:hypothetical protein [Rhodococcus fascians]
METVTAESLREAAEQLANSHPKNPYPAIVVNLQRAADLLDNAEEAARSAAQMAADKSGWAAVQFPPLIVGPVQWLLREFGRRLELGGDLQVAVTLVEEDVDATSVTDTYTLSVTETRPR